MKFVALALTILLVAGSQARFLQDEAPSQLQHVRAAVLVYLAQVKESAQKALVYLDDTEYQDYKAKISDSLDDMLKNIQAASAKASPYTDAFAAQITELTAGIREKIRTDIDELRTQLEPKREELRAVLEKHMQEYRDKLEPVVKEYMEKHKAEVQAFQAKMKPIVEELRAKVQTNVEETKSKLAPIVDAVRTKLTERLEDLKALASPFVEEYKEQAIKVVTQLRENIGKSDGLAEELKTKLTDLYATLTKAFTESKA
ncbi:apolipoprotein A-Ib [Denticeps clupeoides]|uniref:Apolipoprotein A-I n=1 Tax=Denticeps clupeoides TaxID=299321 RepID=A0AAY4EM59_9TELE|nr:apolipoprotein A-I-1-like [Denticeps clupeoides]